MAKIQMPEFGNNSDAYRKELEEKSKKPKSRTSVMGSLRKRGVGERLIGLFFEGDLQSAMNYIIYDLAIPQVKTAVLEGMKVLFYGSSRGSSDPRQSSQVHTSYAAYYYGGGNAKQTQQSQKQAQNLPKTLKKSDPRLITVADRGSAERILAELRQNIATYGHTSVADLFDMVNIPSEWTNYDYGWRNLDDARVRPCQEGYWFDLPEAYPIS